MKRTRNDKLRKAILAALGISATLAYSGRAAAMTATDLSASPLTAGTSASYSGNAPKRAWSDYNTGNNYGWTHTAKFFTFQVGTAAEIAAGTRFDLSVDLKQNGGSSPMNYPAFSIWTSGSTPVATGAANNGYGHAWSQVRGPYDGGVADDPCVNGNDCSLGSNGWLGSGGGGNIVPGHDGWVGYANTGYSFSNGDGDKIQGLYAGASNPGNAGLYGGATTDPLNGTALTNVNAASPYVNGGYATLVATDAMLTLLGLKSGYYLIGLAGACPDNNLNGQNCAAAAGQAYKLTVANTGVSAVPIPGAVWLFGSALAGFVGLQRRQLTS